MPQLNKYYRYYFEALGSGFEIELVDDKSDLQNLVKIFEGDIRRLEKRFSRFLVNSEVGVLNGSLNKWVAVSDDLMAIIRRAEHYNQMSDGYFSIGIDRNLSVMGYGINPGGKSKTEFRIKFTHDKIKLNSTIDLGGMGKGMALDMAKKIFAGLSGVCVNAGGDFYITGRDVSGRPWRVFLENAFNTDEVIGEIDVEREMFLASSNPMRRRWSTGHHLINPNTGSLADEMAGVYVQAGQGELADVYSTALFAMGYEKAKLWLAENDFVEAMLVSPAGAIFKTKGFLGRLYSKNSAPFSHI